MDDLNRLQVPVFHFEQLLMDDSGAEEPECFEVGRRAIGGVAVSAGCHAAAAAELCRLYSLLCTTCNRPATQAMHACVLMIFAHSRGSGYCSMVKHTR
jgi:hypothetical protein